MSKTMESVVTAITALLGITILAVLVSKKAQTANVIQSFGSAYASILKVATNPITSAQTTQTSAAAQTFGQGTTVPAGTAPI